MIPRPTTSTRTDTRVPYTTLFRSQLGRQRRHRLRQRVLHRHRAVASQRRPVLRRLLVAVALLTRKVDQHREPGRSEEHTSELQSTMRISYAVFCLKTTTARDAASLRQPYG